MNTWLITGCSTGLGRHLAHTVLARGDQAVVTARNPEQVADIVEGADDRALALELDVTDHEQVIAAVRRAEEEFGGIDVLVNNAGVGYYAHVEEGDEAEVRRMFEINLFGLSDMTRAVLPGMRARSSGMIINMSSIGGLRSFPAVGYFNATKYAVEGLTEALWQEIEPLGLRAMLVEPSGPRADHTTGSAPGTTLGEGVDPQRAAEAIITAAGADNPPHRLLLGNDAYTLATSKLHELREEFDAWDWHWWMTTPTAPRLGISPAIGLR